MTDHIKTIIKNDKKPETKRKTKMKVTPEYLEILAKLQGVKRLVIK